MEHSHRSRLAPSALLLLAALVTLSAVREERFAGTWRGVGGEVDVREIQAMDLRIESRAGICSVVGVTSRDPQFADYAAELERDLGGEFIRRDAHTLHAERVLDEAPASGSPAVVVSSTLHLQPDANRLRLDVELYPEGYRQLAQQTSWDFERVDADPTASAGRGLKGEYLVLRPTFHDAFKVPATGERARSSLPLETGVRYRIRVEGSIALAPAVVGSWVVADAAYVYHAERDSSFFGRTPSRENVLFLDDQAFAPVQDFATTHIYTMDIDGTGRPLSAVVADTLPADNSGTLDLRIYRLHPDVLEAEQPSSIDPALAPVDGLLAAERYDEALASLRDAAARAADARAREELYQLVGVVEFVASRPQDPEELPRHVVMDGSNLFGRAVGFDKQWPSALNNLAIWEAWNDNVGLLEGNARALLEQARRLAPDDTVIAGNLSRIGAQASKRR